MRLITTHGDSAAALIGGIVCRDVRRATPEPTVLFRKGHVLTATDVERLAEAPGAEVRVLMPEENDEPESNAAARLATGVAGGHVLIDPPHQGQTTLRAEQRGLVTVRRGLLRRLNQLDGVLVFTTYDGIPVDQGAAIGGTKVAPLLIPRGTIDAAVEACRTQGPLLDVVPFRPTKVALLATDRLRERTIAQSRRHLSAKLAWFGSSIDVTSFGLHDTSDVTHALEAARQSEVGLVLAAGGVATDPSDVLFEGLRLAGGSIDQFGLPIEPGTACWVGRLGSLPVIGLASCELFGRAGAVDLLLPQVLSGKRLTPTLLQRMAHGGLIDRHLTRIPAYGADLGRDDDLNNDDVS